MRVMMPTASETVLERGGGRAAGRDGAPAQAPNRAASALRGGEDREGRSGQPSASDIAASIQDIESGFQELARFPTARSSLPG